MAEFAVFQLYKLLIFASPGNYGISDAQILANFRRKPQIFAENRRKLRNFAETVCPI